jgi:hypothetical protein
MRLGSLAIVLVVVFVAVPATASAGLIDLRIRFQADAGTKAQLFTLRCADRVTGTVPHPADACRRLQRLGSEAFRPTPPDTACTAIFGGPSTARVTGSYLGRPIWVRLRRDNGCEIARWQRVGFLLPQPAAPS